MKALCIVPGTLGLGLSAKEEDSDIKARLIRFKALLVTPLKPLYGYHF